MSRNFNRPVRKHSNMHLVPNSNVFFMDTYSFVNDSFLGIPRIPILDHTQRFIPIVGVDSLDPINFGGFEPV